MTVMTRFDRADVFYEWVNSVICDWVTSVDLDMLDVDAKIFMENFDFPMVTGERDVQDALNSFVNMSKHPCMLGEYAGGFDHVYDIIDKNCDGTWDDMVDRMYMGCFRYLYCKRRDTYRNFWVLYCNNKSKEVGIIVNLDTYNGLMEWARYNIRKYISDGNLHYLDLDTMLGSIDIADTIVDRRFRILKSVGIAYYMLLRYGTSVMRHVYNTAMALAGDNASNDDRLLWMHKLLFREVMLRHHEEMRRLLGEVCYREIAQETDDDGDGDACDED